MPETVAAYETVALVLGCWELSSEIYLGTSWVQGAGIDAVIETTYEDLSVLAFESKVALSSRR